ncbi:Outer membrane protein OmpA [Fibrobacter sp. UWB15]|jgi:outer membrane protein OmpA-like peptidoglycan-associated protein|uniref:OmpA family protein n=1 Tax=unclassified Fibrobacter TaxID=2634177 RepID=UPI0009202FF4|nr:MULTISPECIES: OmpA family protein [unclassified Fibrobacter]PWJ67720.1 outer membrane protein OmpA-like peptidoglycan-associated protein [Fibrobacter sp. UWB6]SHF76104.1 Outer membrane protein OmpA [Fibrobacter sp. UWB8]SMG14350.1 Outer membrane protein OmpA [Fibrobacter sp. UWB15]
MKTRNLLVISAMAAAFSFAAEEAEGPNAVESCQTAIDNAAKDIPANATSAKYTLAAAKANLIDLDAAYNDDAESDQTKALAAKCDTYAKTIAAQAETQKVRNSTAEKWEKRAATARSIEAIQEQINKARTGKVNDLEAEKAKMKDQEARLQAEMQQNQEKFQAEAAAQEAALKAANQREADLQKELAEERAKAEARQQEAMNKLNELQSQMIQVTKSARGIILSMSDILFAVNKADLKADLKTSLAKVAGILSVYQQFNVSIEGNTDNTGSEEHNMKLSQQRADNVKAFLVEQGIAAERLTAKGLGMTMPVADNSTKEGRQKNRRVDLVIQDKALQQQEAK